MKKLIFITILFFLNIVGTPSYASEKMLPSAKKYDSGVEPSIASYDNIVVETHSSRYFNSLWYKVGIIEGNSIEWGDSYEYDTGVNSSIALDDKNIIEVHESIFPEELVYRIGTIDIDNKKIIWGESAFYDQGFKPSVTMSEDKIIEIHYQMLSNYAKKSKYGYALTTHYRVGVIDQNSKTIDWTYEDAFSLEGSDDSTLASSKDTVVAVTSSAYSKTLWYKVGTLFNSQIDWGPIYKYDSGINPTITIQGNTIIEMHESANFFRLWYRIGSIDSNKKRITWGPSIRYNNGIHPVLTSNNKSVIEAHESPRFSRLYSNIGEIDSDQKIINWSNKIFP